MRFIVQNEIEPVKNIPKNEYKNRTVTAISNTVLPYMMHMHVIRYRPIVDKL